MSNFTCARKSFCQTLFYVSYYLSQFYNKKRRRTETRNACKDKTKDRKKERKYGENPPKKNETRSKGKNEKK